jgi:PAS domain S-box-containing protein
MERIKVEPTGKMAKLTEEDILVSKTDITGIITYGNDKFFEISGYSKEELIGTPHNIIRHPDMPKAIFHLMWKSIRTGHKIRAVVKNLTKNGESYWVTTDFEIQRNREGQIKSYMAFRSITPKGVVKIMEPLYKEMLRIEKKEDMRASFNYLETILAQKDMTYNEFVDYLETPKTFMEKAFVKIKNFC